MIIKTNYKFIIIVVFITIIIKVSTNENFIKLNNPLPILPSTTLIDPSILRRKRLEANAAAIRQHLQQQRDVQVENVGGLLGSLPSINTLNDGNGKQLQSNNLQSVLGEQSLQQQSIIAPSELSQQQPQEQQQQILPPSSSPSLEYQVSQQQQLSTEIYAKIGQQQSQHISDNLDNYQITEAASITPIPTETPSAYETLKTPAPQVSNFKQRIKRTAQPQKPKQSQALLRCLKEAEILDSTLEVQQVPEALPRQRPKAQSPSHRVNVDIIVEPLGRRRRKEQNNQQTRTHGHRTQQNEFEYFTGPSQHPPPQFQQHQTSFQHRPGPGGVFISASTRGGVSDYQQQQFVQTQSPHSSTKIFGGEEHNFGTSSVTGSLSGSSRNSNLPSMISIVGQKGGGGHIPSISSYNLPPGTNAHRYYYPPRIPLPLPTCFHNPTGYPCCNPKLNDLIVETYTMLESKPRFHTCNINAIAQHLQIRAETRFNTSFETVAAFDDFAQKIHFAGDLVCKVEIGGKYMLAYATVKDVSRVLTAEPSDQQQQNELGNGGGESTGTNNHNLFGKRRKRQIIKNNLNNLDFGSQLPQKPLNDLTRYYSMWI